MKRLILAAAMAAVPFAASPATAQGPNERRELRECRSSLLGTLIGAGTGAAIGREIQRGNVRCC